MLRVGSQMPLLGISLGEKSLRVAQAMHGADFEQGARIAEFPYPAGVTFEKAAELSGIPPAGAAPAGAPSGGFAFGRALAHFLQWHGFTARRAVFGIPAKWLICKPYLMPPADPQTANQIMWLHATEEIPTELGAMAFDVVGNSSRTDSTNLLLIGLQRRRLDLITDLAKGAKLKIAGVMPSGCALAAATAPHLDQSLILSMQLENAELIHRDGARVSLIRYIGSAAPGSKGGPNGTILAELRRTAAGMNSKNPTKNIASLVLWDDAGLEPPAMEALSEAANMPVVPAKAQWVDVSHPDSPEIGKGMCAIALALAAQTEDSIVDFLHPTLKPPEEKLKRGKIFWLSVAAATAALVGLAMFVDLANLQRQVSAADDRLDLLNPAMETARRFVANTQFAETFQSSTPRAMTCLRDLTVAVEQDGQTYFTSFTLRGDTTGEIAGRSNSERSVLNLIDKLKADGRFSNLNLRMDTRETKAAAPPVGPPVPPSTAQGSPDLNGPATIQVPPAALAAAAARRAAIIAAGGPNGPNGLIVARARAVPNPAGAAAAAAGRGGGGGANEVTFSASFNYVPNF